jgi:hypothetical protein
MKETGVNTFFTTSIKIYFRCLFYAWLFGAPRSEKFFTSWNQHFLMTKYFYCSYHFSTCFTRVSRFQWQLFEASSNRKSWKMKMHLRTSCILKAVLWISLICPLLRSPVVNMTFCVSKNVISIFHIVVDFTFFDLMQLEKETFHKCCFLFFIFDYINKQKLKLLCC